jgi:hypothetical protein
MGKTIPRTIRFCRTRDFYKYETANDAEIILRIQRRERAFSRAEDNARVWLTLSKTGRRRMVRMTPLNILRASTLLLVALAASAVFAQEAPVAKPQQNLPAIVVTKASNRTLVDRVIATGTVKPVEEDLHPAAGRGPVDPLAQRRCRRQGHIGQRAGDAQRRRAGAPEEPVAGDQGQERGKPCAVARPADRSAGQCRTGTAAAGPRPGNGQEGHRFDRDGRAGRCRCRIRQRPRIVRRAGDPGRDSRYQGHSTARSPTPT